MNKIAVGLVDDHALVRLGLRTLINDNTFAKNELTK